MKILKIKENVHNDLKTHLKDSSVFMQSYVEYIINKAIKKGIVYAMQEKIDDLSNCIYLEKLDKNKGKRNLLKYNKKKKTNFKYFKLIPENSKQFETYLKWTTSYNNVDDNIGLYFNLPTYHNVKNPKIKPEDSKGVLKLIGISRIDSSVQFELLENIKENVEDLLNQPVDGQFQLSIECKIQNITLEDHIVDFDRLNFYDDFNEEQSLSLEQDKYELTKHKEDDIKDFKISLINYIKKNSKLSANNAAMRKLIYSNSDSGIRKLISKIMSLSHLVTEGNKMGPATHCIIPSWITNDLMNSTNLVVHIDSNYNSDDKNDPLRLVGSFAGMNVFESDEVNDLYVYRTCEHSFKLLYSFDKCNVDEIYQDFTIDTDKCIYKMQILKEYDANHINEFVNHKLSNLKFLNIDNTYSPYSLEPFTVSMNNENNKNDDFLLKTGLDLDARTENMLFNTIHQELVKDIIRVDSDKSKELKFFGNEEFPAIVDMFDNVFKECGRSDDTCIIMNGKLGAFIQDISKFEMSKEGVHSASSAYFIGHYGDHPIYVDPYMRYNDDRMFMMNDIQLKYAKDGLLVSAHKNEDFTEINLAYKLMKDIVTINVIDKENRLL